MNDTLYAESEIVDKRTSSSRPTQGILRAVTTARNQNDTPVVRFERTFLIYKRGLGPYEAAGY